jgi:parallel beta-helix repeat protein
MRHVPNSATRAFRTTVERGSRSIALLLRPAVLGAALLLIITIPGVDREARASSISEGWTAKPTIAGQASRATKSPCSKYVSTSGADSAFGSRRRPYRTVARLLSKLLPGQTGCLLSGTFVEDVTIRRGGRPGRRLTLRSAPGSRATLRGRLWIASSADYVTVEYLHLDGRNKVHLPSPTVTGDWAIFRNDDVTNHRAGAGAPPGDGICFDLGFPGYGASTHARIERNRIHDCGISDNHNHGIYVALARDTVIADNYIYGNGDRGIQLYPDADDTDIEHNVIEGNGEGIIFSGDSSGVSERNMVRRNIISHSRVRWNVESWYPNGIDPGSENYVIDNCLWASNSNNYYDARGGIEIPESGFTSSDNRIAAPLFLGRARSDYRQRPNSPCRGYGPRVAVIGALR